MDPFQSDRHFVRIGFRKLIVAREPSDHRAFGVVDFDLDRSFGFLFEVVVKNGASRGIFGERLIERDWRALIATGAYADCRLRAKEPYIGGSSLHIELPQWRDVVQDPKGSAKRGDHQIEVVHDEVANGSGGHVELQRLPGIAVVE